jgi:hypothetical protein
VSRSKKTAKAKRPAGDLASDKRITPKWLLDYARELGDGQIMLDVCTEPGNPTGATAYFTYAHNGLERDWAGISNGGLTWCNTPYSRGSVMLWADKAVQEARRGCEILLLTKDDCRVSWNAFLRNNADARCRIARGVGFLEPDGEGGYRKMVGPMWGSCLWYFGLRRRRFARIFGAIGEISHLLGPQEAFDAAE